MIAFPLSIGVEYAKVQFSTLPGVHLVLYGLLLIVVMIYRPGGVAAAVRSFDDWIARRWRPVAAEKPGRA
jgi:ABC-type branched-subunit amino acid transport system permease subunit